MQDVSTSEYPRYEIVAATPEHEAAVRRLARHLNTVNLPDDAAAIRSLLEHSEQSFAGTLEPIAKHQYMFLLRDRQEDCALGTSMVFAQLGRRDAPYIYFAVRHEEKYSASLDRHFIHTLLDTTYSYYGPTELGGLVMDPTYRGTPHRFGTMISYVRLLFIAMHRRRFKDELLAELLPPFRADGSSALWEAVGRRFTGLSYREADRLSRSNKEFIKGLFPDSIYATLLDEEAQALIGVVGPQTLSVRNMLVRLGFSYAHRVDPFDGGPHYVGSTDQVIAATGARALDDATRPTSPYLVASDLDVAPYFRALLITSDSERNSAPGTMCGEWLGVRSDKLLWHLPLI